MRPWETIKNDHIKEWINEREELWHELEPLEFQKITINGRSYNPFNLKGINSILEKEGYLYSAGYGNAMKPVFILAELSEKKIIENKYIYITGRELARDLSTSPAMIRGNMIVTRRETMDLFYWDKFEEMKTRRCSGALLYAFAEYGISKETADKIPPSKLTDIFRKLIHSELSVLIYHEIGEASQRRRLGKWWKELLTQLPHSRAEFFIRGLKDILADTCGSGTLSFIIKNRKAGSLSFYVAHLGGFRKNIFHDLVEAYEEFIKTRDWDIIEEARISGYTQTLDAVRRLKALFNSGRATPEVIEREFVQGNA